MIVIKSIINTFINLKPMKNTKAQLQKTAKELNRRFGLNPPIDINCDLAHLEVEISKRIYGLMWPIAKGKPS